MSWNLDHTDYRLLDEFQRGLPLVPRPFAMMADKLEISEDDVLARLSELQAQGYVSRVGATIRPNTAGASTLAAVAVPADRIDEVAAIIGAERGVNHSYLREDDWNLWFVATAPDASELAAILKRIEARCGLAVLDLRLVQSFNIDLGFGLSDGGIPLRRRVDADLGVLMEDDRPILRTLTDGLPLVTRPYAKAAAALNMDERQFLSRIALLHEANIISRIGVIVRHRPLGWTSNAMVVWQVPEPQIIQAGEIASAHCGVTLCYQRRSVPGVWPYTLYNMIHARSRREALEVIASLQALPAFTNIPHRVLFSTRCFKQTGALLHREEAAA
jgi:DNA-binding Lrp family transcriptional regulator